MLIERKLPLTRIGELELSLKYNIIYLSGSPESRESHVSCPEDSLFLRNLDFRNLENNSLLLKLSFDGFIDPGLFNGLDYVCFHPDICQFIPESSEQKTPTYFSLIKLSQWFNIKNTKKGNCSSCFASKNLGGKPYCPLVDTDDGSGITFGIYFPLTDEECREYANFLDSAGLILPIVGLSLVSNW
ncbi:hypothetical protein A3K73_08770 [Candidatus Pacearchaeota archaeon RBG_13_36_9]|nr:MAG: hypothetical protein A3K73_08770 [Candidatus Pacearchaeota archaeon RBG_13_36_9]